MSFATYPIDNAKKTHENCLSKQRVLDAIDNNLICWCEFDKDKNIVRYCEKHCLLLDLGLSRLFV